MNTKNSCLGWHLPSFIHCDSEVAHDFKDFRTFYSIFFNCNFLLGFFSCGLGKTFVFNWEYDPICAIK